MDKDEKVSALCEAVASGDVSYARRVLSDGVHPDETVDDGVPPLALAVANGDLAMAAALIEAGADVNYNCESGLSILAVAIQKANEEAVKLLLAKRADPNKRVFSGGRTVLHMASVMGLADIIRALVKGGADVHVQDHDGFTPIMIAIGARKQQAVEALLACGAEWPDKPGTEKKPTPAVIQLGKE